MGSTTAIHAELRVLRRANTNTAVFRALAGDAEGIMNAPRWWRSNREPGILKSCRANATPLP